MKKNLLFLITVILLLFTQCADKVSARKSPAAGKTPEELLSLMTLSEKIGQMTQAERGDVLSGDITKYALGSILSGGGSAPAQNNPEAWVNMVNGFVEESLQTRLGIPVIYGLDAVHGHATVKNATVFPHNVGLGAIAAGNSERGAQAAHTVGRITAKEMLATGVQWNFAPVLGVAEDVRWGRSYESYSENVDIVSLMGSSFIKGLQENGAAACMKHFLGEGQSINGRNQGNALLDRAGIERILPPYRAAIDAGAISLMPSFSSVNGVKMHESKELLTDLLKDEMGFDGFVISDWAALTQLSGENYKAQIANAINAGVDMVMATNGRTSWELFITFLTELVNEGKVPLERIDDAVLRILRFKQRIGLFESPLTKKAGVIGTDAHRAEARKLAAESLVLLQNKNNVIAQLPSYKRILVAGQGANDIGMQCGGWTITWQGLHGPITKGTTILEGIQNAVKGKAEIVFDEYGKTEETFDAVIAVIGEGPYAESQGDRYSQIDLRIRDINVLWEAYDYDCPLIVIMLSGRPMTLGDEYKNWDALIAAWLPGAEGGGIADVLFGKSDFTGRTPYTWRKTTDGEVLFPFGYGLSKNQNTIDDFEYKTKNDSITITGYQGSLKDVIIPGKINGLPVTAIGREAFFRKSLTSIKFPDAITVIGDKAFSYNRLSTLVLPKSLVSVGFLAFSSNKIKNITLPDNIVSIGMWAFAENRIKNLTLPGSLDYVGDGAFTRNYLDDVSVPMSVWAFNSRAFDSFVSITWY